MRNLWVFMTGIGIAATLESIAIAGVPPPGAPGPVLAAGIPALIGLGYLYKRVRNKHD